MNIGKKKIIHFADKNFLLSLFAYLLIAGFFTYETRPYFPSLDSPAHLHNSLLLKEYLQGNETVRENFELNGFYIPNLFSNYFLAVLQFAVKLTLAGTLFFMLYYFLLLLAFRYLLKIYGVSLPGFYALTALLFCNSFLLNFGFFNFCWSLVFFCYSCAYFHKSYFKQRPKALNFFGLLVLMALLYYSSALAMLMFLLFAGIELLFKWLKTRKDKSPAESTHLRRSCGFLILSALPFLFLFFYFVTHSQGLGFTGPGNNMAELTGNLFSLNSMILYTGPGERPFTIAVFLVLMVWFMQVAINRFRKKLHSEAADVLLWMSMVLLFLYFLIPDSWSVGMMNLRLQFFAVISLVLWLLVQDSVLRPWAFGLLILISAGKFLISDRKFMKELKYNAYVLYETGKQLPSNKTVLPLDLSDQHLMKHFSNYMGLYHPQIILENYEAQLDWFPLKWKKKTHAHYFFWGEQLVGGQGVIEKKPEYVLLYGHTERLHSKSAWKAELDSAYDLVYKSPDNFAWIYKCRDSKN